MGVTRRWILPVLRLVVFAAIAAALVKLAFFGGLTAASDTTIPTGSVSQPTVSVTEATVKSDVVLAATITADAAVPVRATAAGEVVKVLVTTGQSLGANAAVATVRAVSADGVTPGKVTTLTTSAAGTVSDVPVLAGQQLSVGDVLAQVAPPTFSVVGTMPPEQQYRLVNRPTEGAVTVTGGPEPFTCTNLTISTPLAGAGESSSASGPSDGGDSGSTSGSTATTTVRCAVPGGVTVFSGIAAKLTVSGGVAENALTVPVTAVEGAPGGSGVVYTMADDGTPQRHAVKLGVTDGKVVAVTEGVAKGDDVLEFVPGGTGTSTEASAGNGG
ncbi:HlyD family efflux transporter periplasmic adaptor subunit [Curtobacterium sp. RRHDQ10]|uniref:HlyD family efflux transporter periplasmic adaptor subunit n=1 Tax=Curtobacterium phyllosphaerae TaxID=3413379 RepID=UPI003BF3F78B